MAAGLAQQAVQGLIGHNGMGVITLNRPKALNAMNLEMDVTFKNLLDDWENNARVKAILVLSSSHKAFSAGMDIKSLAGAVQDDRRTPLVSKVFEAEYTLICKIARLQKPYVSIIDGITMGFGIGLSCHGGYRVVTERTVLAMPENGIGLFPDVGFAHAVAKSPGNGALGAYLALSGARINNPADALYVGLGSHYVPSENLGLLKEALLQRDLSSNADGVVQSVLSQFSEVSGSEGSLERLLPSIVSCFGGNRSVLDSLAALKTEEASSEPGVTKLLWAPCTRDHSILLLGNTRTIVVYALLWAQDATSYKRPCYSPVPRRVTEWAKGALSGIAKGSPFSLCITQQHFGSVSAAASDMDNELNTIEGVLKAEYRLALRAAIREDFIEGVRAVVIDKDQNPQWNPSSLERVDPLEVFECFKPLVNAEELQV